MFTQEQVNQISGALIAHAQKQFVASLSAYMANRGLTPVSLIQAVMSNMAGTDDLVGGVLDRLTGLDATRQVNGK